MKIKSIICTTAAMSMALQALAATDTVGPQDIKLDKFKVEVHSLGPTLSIDIALDIKEYSLPRDREMTLTPILVAKDGSDSLALAPITVAGRNQWYYYLRNGLAEKCGAHIYRAGTDAIADYSTEVDFKPWMGHSTLEMRFTRANCCDRPELLIGPSPRRMVPMAAIDTDRPALDAPFIFAPPVDAGPVTKAIEGSAFVTFVVNRTELKPDYMNNPAELQKIINSIEFVRRDPDASITHVHFKGYASPEGPYDNNVRLAKGRTETLRRYVRDLYSFNDTTVTSSYQPEDWDGLRKYVTDSMDFDIQHRAEILDIIDGPLGLDDKNRAIQVRFPEDYRVILRQIYPWLRHSDYTVNYQIKIYTDIEEIRHAFATDPSRLRNVDFYTLAQSYPEGSKEYCDVFEKAVEVYPDDPMLNLNAANIELRRGNLDMAQSHLLKAGNTAQANYARGILAADRRDFAEAIRRFELARQQGLPGMEEVIRRAAALRDYHPVTYFVGPRKD